MDKEYILNEIKRTAEENGGKALGKLKFSAETGIKEYDWHGKYWLRWSDALKEAGYEPNTLSKPYDDELLLKKLIELIRELGKYPIFGELVFKRNNDQNFPHPSAFTSRYCKNDWLKMLIEYCCKNDNLSDVLQICQSAYKPQDKLKEGRLETNNEKFGFVYLRKYGKHYKIGRSNDTGRRGYEIGLKLPEKSILIHEIRTGDPAGIEKYWHNKFADKRRDNSEWFDLTAGDISYFRRRKFM